MQLYSCWAFFVDKPEVVEAADRLLAEDDWVTLLRDYKLRWFNYDPYQPFNPYHSLECQTFTVGHNFNFNKIPDICGYSPGYLQEAPPPINIESTIELQRGVQFFNRLSIPSFVHNVTSQLLINSSYMIDESLISKNSTLIPTIAHCDRHLKILPVPQEGLALTEQFLMSLRHLKHPTALSVVGGQNIHFEISCSAADQPFIERQLTTYFKDAIVLPAPANGDSESPSTQVCWAIPELAAPPLNTHFKLDPYAQLFTAFEQLSPDSSASMSIYFAPMEDQPFRAVIKTLERESNLFNNYGKKNPISIEMQQCIRNIEKKFPFWAMAIKFTATDLQFFQKIPNFLSQYHQAEAKFVIKRDCPLSAAAPPMWGFCSTEELASLAHFPTKTINSDLLETASMKSKLPPESYTKDGIEIGRSEARGQIKPVVIPLSARDRHTYIVGKSGTGKSTLIYNAICQDISDGYGVAVIDPHGDLVEDILRFIPEHRVEDTVYFNAADKQYPIGINMFNAESEEEIGLLADDLLVTFKRISETWGERLDTILRYVFYTLLHYEDTTFLDIERILLDARFRAKVLDVVKIDRIRSFWETTYENYPKDANQPIINRMTKFALSPILSGILGQANAMLSFFDVIQNRKILLVNLSKGKIGEDTAQLLGSLIVSQIQLAIMRRAELAKESREPYFLYVDEFQNFTTSAFEKILSEARKYKLCLTLAHQYISQLDEKTKNAILANVGTIIMFQSYPLDAQALRPELGQYTPDDVTNLNTSLHEALCKPATQSKDTFKFQTLPPLKSEQSFKDRIIEYTRENYATPLEPTEKESTTPPPSAGQAPPRHKRPVAALPKEFANNADRILHYVSLASYLSQGQIQKVCYSHVSPTSRGPAASRDLKNLVESKKIKMTNFGKEKIYFLGRTCNPTGHNVAVREMFSKILLSGFEIAKVNFFPTLGGLNPDLLVEFLAEEGALIKTFWEYDTGSEHIPELADKVKRYAQLFATQSGEEGRPFGRDGEVIFVFNSEQRLQQVSKVINAPIIVAVLDQFETLNDPAFKQLGSEIRAPLFQ